MRDVGRTTAAAREFAVRRCVALRCSGDGCASQGEGGEYVPRIRRDMTFAISFHGAKLAPDDRGGSITVQLPGVVQGERGSTVRFVVVAWGARAGVGGRGIGVLQYALCPVALARRRGTVDSRWSESMRVQDLLLWDLRLISDMRGG